MRSTSPVVRHQKGSLGTEDKAGLSGFGNLEQRRINPIKQATRENS